MRRFDCTNFPEDLEVGREEKPARFVLSTFAMSRLSLAAVVVTLLTGCAVSGGTFYSRYGNGPAEPRWQMQVDGRLQPLGDRNLVVGLDGRVPPNLVPGHCCDELSAALFVGYGKIPQRDGSRLGFEVGPTVGYERLREHDHVKGGAALGGQLAVPIRLSGSRTPWDTSDTIDFLWMIVPEVGGGVFRPTASDRQGELRAGLSLRLQMWTALFP